MVKNKIKYMIRLIKQAFTVLSSFSRSLAIKCMSLNKEPCMIRSILDINPSLHSLIIHFFLEMLRFKESYNLIR